MRKEKRQPNALERVAEELRGRFPKIKLELDPAETKTGAWFLDARLAGHHIVVEWRPERGFGVTSNAALPYGAGADEAIFDEADALVRIAELLITRGRTRSGSPIAELRESRATAD